MRTSEFEGQQASALGFLECNLGRRELLIVLDNCEHLVAASAELAVSLLSACPSVRLLATSREPLGVPGEAVFEVEPLHLPAATASAEELAQADAVRLFVERARTVRGDLDLDEETLRAIAEVCARLDGLPLALELAAARTRTLSPPEIAERLADRFALLGRGPERLAERQRTLAGVVEWSYQLLGEDEQTLFRRLCVFPSSFGLEAAEEVCSRRRNRPVRGRRSPGIARRPIDGRDLRRGLRSLPASRDATRVRACRGRCPRRAARCRAAPRRLGDAYRRGRPCTGLDGGPRGGHEGVRAAARGLRSSGRSGVRARRRRPRARASPPRSGRSASSSREGPTTGFVSRRRSRSREAHSSAVSAACARSPCS